MPFSEQSERMPFVAILCHQISISAKLKNFADNTATIKNKFLNLWCSLRIADIISESVSLILRSKIWRFYKHKDSNNTHHRVWISL